MVWYGMIWYGMVWYGMVWYGMVRYGTVQYSMVLYGMVWHGVAWYGMVYGMVYSSSLRPGLKGKPGINCLFVILLAWSKKNTKFGTHRDLIVLNMLRTLGVLLRHVARHVAVASKNSNYLMNCQWTEEMTSKKRAL